MKQSEYNKLACELTQAYSDAIVELNKKYSIENAEYKVGDIIKDHVGIGKIVEVKPCVIDWVCDMYVGYPEAQYIVDRQWKENESLRMKERDRYRIIYKGNIIEKVG